MQKPEKRPWDVSTVVVQDVILLVVEVVKVDATELAKMLAMDVSTHAKEHVKTPVLELVNIQVVDSYCVNEVVPVFLTCLLYTSPSPRDRSVSRMPSSA